MYTLIFPKLNSRAIHLKRRSSLIILNWHPIIIRRPWLLFGSFNQDQYFQVEVLFGCIRTIHIPITPSSSLKSHAGTVPYTLMDSINLHKCFSLHFIPSTSCGACFFIFSIGLFCSLYQICDRCWGPCMNICSYWILKNYPLLGSTLMYPSLSICGLIMRMDKISPNVIIIIGHSTCRSTYLACFNPRVWRDARCHESIHGMCRQWEGKKRPPVRPTRCASFGLAYVRQTFLWIRCEYEASSFVPLIDSADDWCSDWCDFGKLAAHQHSAYSFVSHSVGSFLFIIILHVVHDLRHNASHIALFDLDNIMIPTIIA